MSCIEFLLQLDDSRGILWRRARLWNSWSWTRFFDEADEEQVARRSLLDADFDRERLACAIDLTGCLPTDLSALSCAFERFAKLSPKPLPRHDEDIAAGFA